MTKHGQRRLVAFLIVVGLAAFFRLHRIDDVPHGLFFDEAQNGLDAWSIANGESLPVFVEAGSAKSRGREAMLHYLMAGVFQIAGPTISGIRLTVAGIGIAGVAAFFLLCERLFGLRAALAGGILLAVGRWHVTMSRVGVRAVLTPLWIVLVLLAAHRLVRRRTRTDAALFGALLGAGFYTYPAYWILPPALALLLAAAWWRGRWRPSRRDLRLAAVGLAASLIVTAPLLGYAIAKPDHFFARAAVVAGPLVASESRLALLRDHAQRALFMLHLRGEAAPMYNVPGRPALDPISGVAFLLGLAHVLRRLTGRPWLYGALLGGWLLPLLAGVIGHDDSWGMRSIGALPAVAAIAGLGVADAARRLRGWGAPRAIVATLLVASLGVAAVWNYRDYFTRFAEDPGVQGAYGTDMLRFHAFCAGLSREADVYLSPYLYYSPTFRFLELSAPGALRLLDAAPALTASPAASRDRVLALESAPLIAALGRVYPERHEVGRYSVWGQPGGVVLRIAGARLRPTLSDAERFEADYWFRRMHAAFAEQTRDW